MIAGDKHSDATMIGWWQVYVTVTGHGTCAEHGALAHLHLLVVKPNTNHGRPTVGSMYATMQMELVKAKFHYAIWFEDGRWPASNQIA